MNTRISCEQCGSDYEPQYFILPWLNNRVVIFCDECGDLIKSYGLDKSILSVPFGTQELDKEETEYVIDLLVNASACPSRSMARRLIYSGGVNINGKQVTNLSQKLCYGATRAEIKIKSKKTFVLLK